VEQKKVCNGEAVVETVETCYMNLLHRQYKYLKKRIVSQTCENPKPLGNKHSTWMRAKVGSFGSFSDARV
jgi:hypothetical protein